MQLSFKLKHVDGSTQFVTNDLLGKGKLVNHLAEIDSKSIDFQLAECTLMFLN